ncbi:hypothetical protein BSL78_15359 [Apostichopus japonicus]|uniref:Uncharacterized protein n=1 Tax=Stichopus japonicus TaxID=307972 RepID=A0A2G8KII1_STIJA|nr:hypothetical protein BSL78_15359 [Apostichopus japonicus]
MWISTFDNLIASRANTAAEKLNLLSQHLEGEPLTMISGYLLMQDSVAYDKARKKLHYWYGGDAVISRAFLGKLENWPKINGRDSAGLKRLSNFLDEICAAKGSIHDLGILDYPQENYKIIAKLPLYIESKWRTVIMKYNNNEGHFPSFEVFAKFIAERAEEANIPTFDCHANETVSYQYQRSSNKKSCATYSQSLSLATYAREIMNLWSASNSSRRRLTIELSGFKNGDFVLDALSRVIDPSFVRIA